MSIETRLSDLQSALESFIQSDTPRPSSTAQQLLVEVRIVSSTQWIERSLSMRR